MIHKRFTAPAMVMTLTWLAGCSQEPTADIDAAVASIANARAAEADVYAPAMWMRADSVLLSMNTELEVQRGKSAISRSFDAVAQYAEQVRATADSATSQSAQNKEAARVQAADYIQQVQATLSELRQMMSGTTQATVKQAERQSAAAELAALEQTTTRADSAYSAARYMVARTEAQSALSQADQLKNRLTALRSSTRRTG